MTIVQDMLQLQEATAALGSLRRRHILILLQMEGYLVLTVINDKYKRVCRCFSLDFHRKKSKMKEEAGKGKRH